MAKTRSNKRPTTTNATVVDKASLGNTTTTPIPTTTPTKALSTVVNTRTRSKKSKDELADEKSNNVINNKKNSKIKSSTLENTHNTRRRGLNNTNIKHAAGDMDTPNVDSSPETGTDSNEIHSPESMSDNEHEVLKVIEIVDESQIYNMPEDDEDEEGKVYELMYVEDGEEGDGEIEYLNEEYLLDDDFILQQNDDNSQNSMIIEEQVDDFTIDTSSHEAAIEAESVPNVQHEIIVSETVKIPPIVPMATRSRRGHVTVTDDNPEQTKCSRRKSRISEKSTDGDIPPPNKISEEIRGIKKEPETSNMEPLRSIFESTTTEEIAKTKVFIPNIEPPATRARSRKSISISDPVVPILPVKEEILKNPVEHSKTIKSDVTVKNEKEKYINHPSKNEENSKQEVKNNFQPENLAQDTSLSESKPINIDPVIKKRSIRLSKRFSASSPPESSKSVLMENKDLKSSNNQQHFISTDTVLDESKSESTKELNQKSVIKTNEDSINTQNCEEDIEEKVSNMILENIANEMSKKTIPLIPTLTVQPVPIRSTRYNKSRFFKPNVEPSVDKLNLTKHENIMKVSETIVENELKIKMDVIDKKPEENESLPPEINVKIQYSSITEIDSVSMLKSELQSKHESECHGERVTESPKTNKNKLNSGSDLKTEMKNTILIPGDNENNDHVSEPEPIIEPMEVDLEKNPVALDAKLKDTSGLRKTRKSSRKDISPPSVPHTEKDEENSDQTMISKLVPEIADTVKNTTTDSSTINSSIEVTTSISISNSPEKVQNEEYKNSQEEKTPPKATSSRSHLAYTSIISTRRQKKEQIKSESLKPLENISDNCMAIVEKLLQESSINKLTVKNIESTITECTTPDTTTETSNTKSVNNVELTVDTPTETNEPTETPMEVENSMQLEKMEEDHIDPSTEEDKETEIFKVPIELSIEEKLKNIKLDQIQPNSDNPDVAAFDPNSTKIKEFETKINRNFYAEAFAGLSHETRTHIFEALLRSKADTKAIPNTEAVKEELAEFDDKKSNIFVKKKSNKKIKKSSKKEKKIDKNESTSTDDNKIDDDESLRRSSRIKTICQSRQRSHGHGLVKPRDRFHDMDDEMDEENTSLTKYKALEVDAVESKDYSPTEETETEVRREREMIQRLKQFTTIKENIYHCDKNISKEAKKMTCDCFLTKEEIERGELGCGEDCLNRLLMIECGPKCVVAERCTNRKFQKTQYANCKVFQTEKKGFGIMAGTIIPPGEFIMEYVGEVLNSEQFEKRADDYSKEKNKHYYFMALRSDAVIDATSKGNVSRFINHSCDPNAETQKWTVNGELRIGFFSTRVILKGEEITFDYQFQRYGKEAQKCYCEASNCRGWIGEEPDSADEDDDDEEEEDEDEDQQQQLQLPPPPQEEKTETVEIPPVVPVVISEFEETKREEIPAPVVESTISVSKEITEKPISVVPEEAEIPPVDLAPVAKEVQLTKEVATTSVEKIKKPTKKERKALVKTRKTRSELLEDADLEEEINILNRTGLKNQAHTLKLSRLMVRAKLMNARLRLLHLLQNGEMPCRRLFLDYHGLRLLHGWMSDSSNLADSLDNKKFQLKLLDTLKGLPIPNKTMLKDSKVINLVQKWSLDDKKTNHYSPSDDTPSDSGSGTPIQQNDSPNHVASQSSTIAAKLSVCSTVDDELSYVGKNIIKMSLKLIENWESLPEVFRIPKKERIEQMKEHEREADLRYKALGLSDDKKEKYDRYHEKSRLKERKHDSKSPYNSNNNSSNKPSNTSTPQLDKYQRRQMFEMKFAKEQEEKKKQEHWRLHEMTCTCFRLDSRKTAQEDVPAIVNPATGQWYTKEMKPVPTPPSHSHIKPPEQILSTNPDDYILPEIDLPQHWKFAIDTKGRIYYYHIKIRIPQWEPPIFLPPLEVAEDTNKITEPKEKDVILVEADKESSSTDTTDSSEDELKERINNLKQRFKDRGQPLPEINITDSELVESLDTNVKHKDNFSDTFPRIDPVKSSYKINKRKRRREGLVQERIISPRSEEDKIYGQQQSRMYRETKEKLRRRKEEMRKRRLLETGGLSMRNNKIVKLTDGLPVSISPYDSDESDDESEHSFKRNNDSLNQNDPDNAVDFVESLISHNMSDNDARLLDGLKEIGKEKVNKKNVYEEWKKQQAKLKSDARKRELNQNKLIHSTSASSSSSSSSHGKRRKIAIDNLDLSSEEIRRIKEKFRTDIAGVIVQHLVPYRKESCKIGRIVHDEDFKHLARKLTHFVMLKELKHCDNTVNILEVTDSVKIKSREFIKKYMTKYGAIYRRGENEPDYKD